MSYKITRGIREGHLGGLGVFWGGLRGGFGGWGFLGRPRGGQEGSAWPLKGTFSPSGSLVQDKFGSKHHIMVQLTNIYKVGINDPFLGLSGHYQGPPKGDFITKQAILRPQIVPNLAFCPLKWSSDGINWPDIIQNNPFWYYGPADDHFRGQKARLGTIWGLKMACLAMKLSFWGPW